MKRDALHLLRCIYRANKHQNRVVHLDEFLDELELLKLEIRTINHEAKRTKNNTILAIIGAR